MPDKPESEGRLPRIVVMPDGPYHIFGNVPLVHKTEIVSEYGEPLTWEKDKVFETKKEGDGEYYSLCRCGHSQNKPFCDGAHNEIDFDGTETADTRTTEQRGELLPHGSRIIVKKDNFLCNQSGFCGLRDVNIFGLVPNTADTKVRSLVIAMVERCPAGALTYRMEEDSPNIEQDLPVLIAVTTEITSKGSINGPLWVTGNIPIERADGKPMETRNRVNLCRCGHSSQKPLCDGSHRALK